MKHPSRDEREELSWPVVNYWPPEDAERSAQMEANPVKGGVNLAKELEIESGFFSFPAHGGRCPNYSINRQIHTHTHTHIHSGYESNPWRGFKRFFYSSPSVVLVRLTCYKRKNGRVLKKLHRLLDWRVNRNAPVYSTMTAVYKFFFFPRWVLMTVIDQPSEPQRFR